MSGTFKISNLDVKWIDVIIRWLTMKLFFWLMFQVTPINRFSAITITLEREKKENLQTLFGLLKAFFLN